MDSMKREKAKQQVVAAIEAIIRAAKELARAEQAYYERKPREPRRGASHE
jgi:hypothetical protein